MLQLEAAFPCEFWAEEIDLPTSGWDFEAGREYGAFVTVIQVTVPEVSYTLGVHSPEPGLRVVDSLFATPDPWTLCVVARGTAYLGDVRNPSSYYEVSEVRGSVIEVIPLPDVGILLLSTGEEIIAIDEKGVRWFTPRIAVDGIRVDGHDLRCLWGAVDYEWNPEPFSIELATGKHEGQSRMLVVE